MMINPKRWDNSSKSLKKEFIDAFIHLGNFDALSIRDAQMIVEFLNDEVLDLDYQNENLKAETRELKNVVDELTAINKGLKEDVKKHEI